MKKLLKLTLLLLVLLLPATAKAYSFAMDGIYYNIIGTNQLEVTYKAHWSATEDDPEEWEGCESGNIPASVAYNGVTYSVTSIGERAFNESDITSITIPPTITSIKSQFTYNLTRVNITDIAAWCRISFNDWSCNPCFFAKHLYLNGTEITDLVIPSSVTAISAYAFYNCSSLTSVTIPNNVTSIGTDAFYNCTKLTKVYMSSLASWCNISFASPSSNPCYYAHYLYLNGEEIRDIVIPYSVSSIKDYAFIGCNRIKTVTLRTNVYSIGKGAFNSCNSYSFTSIDIPNSVTSIGSSAFYNCTYLSDIGIPNSATSIGSGAFYGTAWYNGQPDGVVYAGLVAYSYKGTSYPNEITIRDGTVSIAPSAFANHYSITFNLPNSVVTIGDYAFYNCSRLNSINIPNSVNTIGDYAFQKCRGLTSISLGNSVSTIGNYAFYDCSGLTGELNIPNSVTSIGYSAFYNCSGLTGELNIPNSVTAIGGGAFSYCRGLTSLIIGSSLNSIGTTAFQGCSGLTSINVNNSNTFYDSRENCNAIIETASNSLIYGCKNTMIPNTVVRIDSYAFCQCYGLTYIDIPSSVSTIGERAFSYCDGLISITIPESVTSIGSLAFYSCDSLKNVYSYISRPSQVNGKSFFDYDSDTDYWGDYYSSRTLYVPHGSAVAYRAYPYSSRWAQYFGSIVEMAPDPVLVTSIELDMTETEITEGESLQLTATVLPEDATDKSVTWASSNEAVATVDENGLVTAVVAGTAIISASTIDGSNLTAFCTVTVEPNIVHVTSIELNQTSAGMTEGETLQLTATVLPEDATDKTVTWASSDEAVATVDQNGLVTAVAPGTATITATTIDGSDLSTSCEVTVSGTATVNNSLDADAMSIHTGEEKQLAVRMDNESSITALQCDIYLPEGISIATDDGDYLIDLVPARKATNHTVSTNDLPNGAIRLFITSATSKPFKGNSGDLFILNLIVDENAESGEYSIDLRNVILSDTEAHPYYAPDLNVPVTVLDYIKGDVNIDGTVNVSDYVATANYILEMDPHPFLFVAADIDENLTINVSDLVGVANIALNFMGAPAINHALAMGYDDGQGLMSFGANCSTIAPSKHVVTLDLSNSSAVTAFQMDINLPDGLKLTNATLSDRATASHNLEMTMLTNGAYRLLGASMMSKAFAGSEGALLTLEIEGTASGMAIIDGIMLAEPDATLHKHDAMTLTFDASGVHEMNGDVRIYTQDGMVVVESPVADKVQFILPNGMSIVREVKAGRNVYNTGLVGVVIVKVGNQVKKFRL